MMKRFTGIVLCLALLLGLGTAYAEPKVPETVHTYAETEVGVKLAFNLYESFKWSIPEGDPEMTQFERDSFGTLAATEVYVGRKNLNMYISSQNNFKLKFDSEAEAYHNISLKYDVFDALDADSEDAVNKRTPKSYDDATLYKVFTIQKKGERSVELYYEVVDTPRINGTYIDYLTFYALVEDN